MTAGTVKWFNPSKGFGFIAPEGGGKRLDELEARIRARDAEEPDKLKTRLGALAALRESLR